MERLSVSVKKEEEEKKTNYKQCFEAILRSYDTAINECCHVQRVSQETGTREAWYQQRRHVGIPMKQLPVISTISFSI